MSLRSSRLKLRRWYRGVVIAVALLAGAALALLTDGRFELIDGFLYDASLAPGSWREPRAQSPVVVIAIDRDSLSSAKLAPVPRVLLGPYFAQLLDGLFRADTKAVGFDVIFAYAASRFEAIDRNYDAPLLAALAKYRDRVVLARTVYTQVADPMVAAIFDSDRDAGREEPSAISYSELFPDGDGVQRWFSSQYEAEDGSKLPTLAARLAEIAGGPTHAAPFLLAPTAPVESIPTYAIADVLNCIETSPETVKEVFGGKVVLVGSNLAEEDRKRAPDRFLRWPRTPAPHVQAGAPNCRLAVLGASDPGGSTVPGVHIHAAAVSGLLTGNLVRVVPAFVSVLVSMLTAAAGAAIALLLSPARAVTALATVAAALFVGATAALAAGYRLPIAIPAVAAICAMIGGLFVHFLVEERRRRRVELAFGHYLAPAIVDQLAQADTELHLGGQVREITVMFADLRNFTEVSDTMGPQELLELTNHYFKVIVEAIEETGGYVDKFVGDSVMALWGAPALTSDSAAKAVASAFLVQRRVEELRAADAATSKGFAVKIGISTGAAIVGNVGAPRRFNYSALGATVNLAARIEKVCGEYGCSILIDAATASYLGDRYLLCEVDSVKLKGKSAPVSIYQPIAERQNASVEQREFGARYEAALALYRRGDRAQAARIWEDLQDSAPKSDIRSPSRAMALRARQGNGR